MERDPIPSDFVGRTIKRIDTSACNVWRFYFEDGFAIAIEADIFSQYNLPILQVCVECATEDADAAETSAPSLATYFLTADIEEAEATNPPSYEDRIEAVERMRRLGISDDHIEEALGVSIPHQQAVAAAEIIGDDQQDILGIPE